MYSSANNINGKKKNDLRKVGSEDTMDLNKNLEYN
jgi:hypothetical protein